MKQMSETNKRMNEWFFFSDTLWHQCSKCLKRKVYLENIACRCGAKVEEGVKNLAKMISSGELTEFAAEPLLILLLWDSPKRDS